MSTLQSRPLLRICTLLCLGLNGCSRSESNATVPAEGIGAKTHDGVSGPIAGYGGPLHSTESTQADVDTRPGGLRFADVTDGAGLEFTYRNGEEANQFTILESMGGGVALFDFDRDERLDPLIPGGGLLSNETIPSGLPAGLFRNLSKYQFRAVAGLARLFDSDRYTHGAAAADYDADGFQDVVITGYGGLSFYRNLGDGTFLPAGQDAGLDDTLWSTSAAWGDLNADGWLDLYVAHYTDWSPANHPVCPGPPPASRDVCPPRSFQPLPDTLYFGRGDGTFEDVSQAAGLSSDGKGIGVVVGDVDDDGDLDMYVANDTVPNFLYENDGRGRFKDIGLFSGTALNEQGMPDGSMGVDLGDFNLDGRPDIWVANYERESCALYINLGPGRFRHMSQPLGVTAVGGTFVGWGTMFLDVDRDGDEDLFVSNGHVIHFPQSSTVEQVPLLFENLDGKRVRNVAFSAGTYMSSAHRGRGAVAGDIDGDGDLDLMISHVNEPVAVLSNNSPNQREWLALRLVGTNSPRAAIGAVARLSVGGRVLVRQLKGGMSYASSMTNDLYFGLGDADGAERLEVRWPSGATQQFTDLKPGARWLVVEGGGRLLPVP